MVLQRITYSLVGVSSWEMLFNRRKEVCSNTKRYLLLEEEKDALKYIFLYALALN